MSRPYRTLGASGTDEFIVQKSRFIGIAVPVDEEAQALDVIAHARAAHRGANHHCFAYVIGANAGVMRYSDDGEPSGTAGLPMMEVLKQRQLVNCCVVVVRYFGGIHLGAGGLVRAYTKGCVIGLDAAGAVTMAPSQRVQMRVPYPQWDKVQHTMKALPVLSETSEYAEAVTTSYLVRTEQAHDVLQQLQEATDGQLEWLSTEELFYPWQEAPGSA